MTGLRWQLVVAAVATAWGAVGLFVKEIDLNAAALVSWRVALAALAIGAVALAGQGRAALAVAGPQRRTLLVAALLLALHWWLFFETIKQSSVTIGVLFAYLAPVFLALLAPWLLREPLTARSLAALVLALVGMLLVLGGAARPSALATVLGVATGFSYALLIVLAKGLRRSVGAAAIAFWEYLGVALVLGPIGYAAGGLAPGSGRAFASILVLGIVLTGLCGLLYVAALAHVPAQAVGILSYLEPVSAAVLAAIVLGEDLGVRTVVGGLLVLAGGLVVITASADERDGPSPESMGESAAAPGARAGALHA